MAKAHDAGSTLKKTADNLIEMKIDNPNSQTLVTKFKANCKRGIVETVQVKDLQNDDLSQNFSRIRGRFKGFNGQKSLFTTILAI